MRVRVEFTTEPFHGEDGDVPTHVTAAADALREAGLAPDLGPLGTSVDGEADAVVTAVADAMRAALAGGATRMTLTLSDLAAPVDDRSPGAVAGGGRRSAQSVASEPTDLSDGLARLIAAVEDELGSPLAALPRAGKQQAVRLLEERGAFEMRRSAETVAEAMGLTRFTVYNYLNRVREPAEPPAS